MVDREKVITGLECCSVKQSCSGCPWVGIDCNDRLHLAALELLKEQQETLVSFQSTINKLTKALAEQPEQRFFVDSDGKITPLPVQKHGHWIRSPGFRPDFQCSVCKETYVGDCRMFKFCPECGAKMDEEVEQDD